MDSGFVAARADGAARLEELTDELLRRVLHAQSGQTEPDADVDAMLRAVCLEARGRGLRAEELLIVLKAQWRQLPEARRAARDAADELLRRVVTLCIREYYASEQLAVPQSAPHADDSVAGEVPAIEADHQRLATER